MRRRYTNEVVLLIACLLMVAAVLFAWARSRPASTAAGPGMMEASDPVEAASFAWQAAGAAVYQSRCASCHGQGEGTSRVPPLRRHVAGLFSAGQGRAYLVGFLLAGREGSITVDGRTYGPRHPTYADRLSDEQIAAVLNHVLTAWGNDGQLPASSDLYGPADVADQRERMLTPAAVRALRPGP